jgi:hypothetical protein
MPIAALYRDRIRRLRRCVQGREREGKELSGCGGKLMARDKGGGMGCQPLPLFNCFTWNIILNKVTNTR